MSNRVVVAISGASGAVYGIRLIEILIEYGLEVYVVITDSGIITIKHELQLDYVKKVLSKAERVFENDQIETCLSSGTFDFDAFIVCPCSVNTIGAISSNIANTLTTRIAAVAQKEKRKMIIMFREAPLSTSVLQQLYTLSLHGAIICPAAPGFYYNPESIEDLVDFICNKIVKLLGLNMELFPEWNENMLVKESR